MIHPLVEYFRCPEHMAVLGTADSAALGRGLLQVRRLDLLRAAGRGYTVADPERQSRGRLEWVSRQPGESHSLPFDLSEVIENLRQERYPEARRAVDRMSSVSLTHEVYYFFRPLLPVGVRKYIPAAPLEGVERHPVSSVGRSIPPWRS
jgi:hypothetical protein